MTPIELGFIAIIVLFFLLFAGVSIGVSMGLVGFVGFAYINGFDAGLGMIKSVTYRTFANYDLTVIPLFVFMGQIFLHSGIGKNLYLAAHQWFGSVRGGLALATIAACAAFAAICGSSPATAATLGTVALPEMKKYKYDNALATGCVAAAGGLGILIPPSVILIVYGILVLQPIGKLFIAAMIPGLLLAFILGLVVFFICLLRPEKGPKNPNKISLAEKVKALKYAWIVFVLFALIMGGIYFGFFTPNEAASVGVVLSLAYAFAVTDYSWRKLILSLNDTGKTTAMIFIIILGAAFFGYFMAITRLPQAIPGIVASLGINKYLTLMLVIAMYLVLGCFMEGLSMLILTLPVIYPLVVDLGFHPIWFGIIIVVVFEMGLITPPVGVNVFIVAGLDRTIPMGTVFRGIIPFLIGYLFFIAILILFPQIVLFLI